MINPFEKRATEFLRNDSAFLSVVAHEPLDTFFLGPAESGSLFDRLCTVIGTPGSGKTTIATLMQYGMIRSLVSSPNHDQHALLKKALTDCRILDNGKIQVLACRIPMESEYRDFGELHYSEDIKLGLLKSFLQAKSVLLWLNSLVDDYDIDSIKITYRDGTEVIGRSIGGEFASGVLEKAKNIEEAIYSICARLVPPELNELPSIATAPYEPFNAISSFSVPGNDISLKSLKPLVIFDDIHTLHPDQFALVRNWLAQREIPISRWMMMRLDTQTPEAVIDRSLYDSSSTTSSNIGIQKNREITEIWLQSSYDRANSRRIFRKMARNMANKYLGIMPVFQRQGLKIFENILNILPPKLSESNLNTLSKTVEGLLRENGINEKTKGGFEKQIRDHIAGSSSKYSEGVSQAMLIIMIHRYINRVFQRDLIFSEEEESFEPNKPVFVNSGIVDGARIHLLRKFKLPYYYGFDIISDISSENAELFLNIAGELIKASQARIISGKTAHLATEYQHRLLKRKCEQIIEEWSFPKHREVKMLCDTIAEECREKSLEPNASLGGGPNAYGIPRQEFIDISENHPDLAQVVKYGVAYNALSIKHHHKTKNKEWTLIELGGPVLVKSDLTLIRGGFLERQVSDLISALKSA